MKKTYEPETKSAIEQVIDVFNDYIRTSTHFELLWSDKVGYIYISIDNVQGSIGDTGCCVVNFRPQQSYGDDRDNHRGYSVIYRIADADGFFVTRKVSYRVCEVGTISVVIYELPGQG